MKLKIFLMVISLCFLAGGLDTAFALEHTASNGLFSMNIPEGWHWVEGQGEIIITYPDKQTVAIEIQLVPSRKLSAPDIKNFIKEGNDHMVKGIEAHQGVLIDNKEVKLDGIYATRLDFHTAPPHPLTVTYISCFNKGYAMSITYGTTDDTMHSLIDDAVGTLEFK